MRAWSVINSGDRNFWDGKTGASLNSTGLIREAGTVRTAPVFCARPAGPGGSGGGISVDSGAM